MRVLTETPAGVVGVEAGGKLGAEDYWAVSGEVRAFRAGERREAIPGGAGRLEKL